MSVCVIDVPFSHFSASVGEDEMKMQGMFVEMMCIFKSNQAMLLCNQPLHNDNQIGSKSCKTHHSVKLTKPNNPTSSWLIKRNQYHVVVYACEQQREPHDSLPRDN